MPGLTIRPVSLKTAQEYVRDYHRHNKPPVGHKFSVGLYDDGRLVGVATAGRPVARMLDDGLTLEVTRTCTDGTRNANSMLYGAIVRAATALGYARCVTYTQHDESGASLRGAGWTPAQALPARAGWTAPSRPRDDIGSGNVARIRWERICAKS
jgi:hypothetical protein